MPFSYDTFWLSSHLGPTLRLISLIRPPHTHTRTHKNSRLNLTAGMWTSVSHGEPPPGFKFEGFIEFQKSAQTSTQSLYNCCSCGMSTMWMLYFCEQGVCVCCIMCHLTWKQFFCRFSARIWKPYGVGERHRAAARLFGHIVGEERADGACRSVPAAAGAENLHAGEGNAERGAVRSGLWLRSQKNAAAGCLLIQKCVSDMCYLHRRTVYTLHGC